MRYFVMRCDGFRHFPVILGTFPCSKNEKCPQRSSIEGIISSCSFFYLLGYFLEAKSKLYVSPEERLE